MKVAHVVCTDAFAGVERYVTTVASGLADVGCQVVVIGGDPERMAAPLTACGVRWFAGATVRLAAAELYRQGHFDVVHAHMTAAEVAALVAGPRNRSRLVSTRHFAATRGSSRHARLLGRLLTGRIDAQLAISEFVAQRVEQPTIIVPPGIPSSHEPTEGDVRRKEVLVVQRLEKEKRTDLALEVFAASRLHDDGWELVIAGDGHERGRLEAQAARLGIGPSCRFLGPRNDVEDLQRKAAILLAPRPDEPFGLSVVEAMSVGLPVVAAAGGGHLETVGRLGSAALYPPLDVAAGGRVLASLAADPDRRRTYGQQSAALQRAEFSAARLVDDTLAIYRWLLG